MPDNTKKQNPKQEDPKRRMFKTMELGSQLEKPPEEVLPYHISGEPDDLSENFTNNL